MNEIEKLKALAYKLRVLSLKATTEAGSGHPTSCLSAADIVAALFFEVMQYDPSDHNNPNNDRFILSKGHAAPLLYAAWKEVGVLTEEEVLQLRKFDSNLEGHLTPRFLYSEAATGSLGCGLAIGVGMALAARISKNKFYTYVLMGDSEIAEGSVWEACELASYYKLDNLIAIVDINRLGQSTQTIDAHNIEKYQKKFEAFGFNTIEINGHCMESILSAFNDAKKIVGKPTVILACTFKGYGLENIENKEGFHGKAFSKKELPKLLEELEKRFSDVAKISIEDKTVVPHISILKTETIQLGEIKLNKTEKIATRKAYGKAITELGKNSKKVLSLDAEVKNSTFAEIFEKEFPERFFQCFVAEQNMVGMASGLTTRGFIPFASTFACFFSRAHDQIRMSAIGRVPLRLAGSHAGVSIGQDGPSQMGLEDIALMRALPESIVLYPSDGVSTFRLIELMANYNNGISYIRLTRSETEVIYDKQEKFEIGGCKVVRSSDQDQVLVIAAGITLFEALKAYEILKSKNIFISVIDLYSVKPLDRETILKTALKSKSKIITVEDHYIQGGIGEAVSYELRNTDIQIECLAIFELPKSGSPEELMSHYKIDSEAIMASKFFKTC